jgi:exopolysaccharide biosynthesis polyprenyl glycosylphosphotransferase
VSAAESVGVGSDAPHAAVGAVPSERMRELIERREAAISRKRRGWLMTRMLLAADVLGLSLAFFAAQLLFGVGDRAGDVVSPLTEFLLFFCTLPGWIVVAKLYELYDLDEERTEHTTVDDLMRVFHLVTVGTWLFFAASWLTGFADPNLEKLISFWALAVGLVTLGRASARTYCRRRPNYIQNTIIVGAGEVGQLIARKLLQHPEYGISLVGFVDDRPREQRGEVAHLRNLGSPARLPDLVRRFEVERVIIAFSDAALDDSLELVRSLKRFNVQIDVVPRLFEVVGPNVNVHSVEGLPLIGLPSSKLFPFSRRLKRAFDIVGAAAALVLTAPVFGLVALLIKRDSPGPVLFRQTRLGMHMREFTAFKFRTMVVGADDGSHREFIRRTMSASAAPTSNGLYKLEREDAITRIGRWLRKTSLDELPQLLNVLRGEMSLVGPRPCLAYETEHFAPHHFERFLVPAGITGLWQVTARAHSTFGEALEMDVAYARNWSLGLDLWLVLKTPFQILRQRRGTA